MPKVTNPKKLKEETLKKLRKLIRMIQSDKWLVSGLHSTFSDEDSRALGEFKHLEKMFSVELRGFKDE